MEDNAYYVINFIKEGKENNFSFEKYTDMYNYLNKIYKDPKVTSIELYTTLGVKLNYYSYITD